MQIPAFKILTRTARKFQPYASRAQPHDRRQGSKTGLRPLLWASAELQQPDTCYLKRCNQRPGTDTWRLGNARCAPQHATYFQAFSKTVNNDPGKVGPPNCTTENQPRHNQRLYFSWTTAGPAQRATCTCNGGDAQQVMLSLLAQRHRHVRRHCCAAVEGVLRQSRTRSTAHQQEAGQQSSPISGIPGSARPHPAHPPLAL